MPIEKLVDGGFGLGRWEGRIVFVPGACPGEDVQARVTSVKKGYAEAELQTILKPSPDRVAPHCPVFGTCGGCQWQQLAYPAQREAKVEILRENLGRIGKQADPDIPPSRSAADPFGYRTRIQLKTDLTRDKPAVGYYAVKSHRLVPIETCPIASPPLNQALVVLRALFDDPAHRLPSLTDLHLHLAQGTGELQIRYFAEDEPQDRVEKIFTRLEESVPNAVSQVYYSRTGRRRIRGRDYLIDRYKDIPFRISDRSFAQVNWEQSAALIDTVRTFARLTGRESVLELYCGIGTFGLFLAREATRLIGFDENGIAVEDANYNARQQGLANGLFTAKPVEQAVAGLVAEKRTFDCVVMDPPRKGMDRKTLRSLTELAPSRIVYVSCNPATLARDLKILTGSGYRLGRLQPIDLFPQTYHLETVAELIRV
ncbi:MAG: 23S rRNA (uracil(1939)-C(5))-methyltransferase RlmD [Nitrospirae bacterium]|nr:23S rRNA (uracil(1939)-C(5))-methyltransferase RlmD [Nitrospirota bacterium]